MELVTPALLEVAALGPVPNDVDRPLAAAMNLHLPKRGIVTPLRVAHFLAHAAHETMGFKRFVERGNGDKNGDGLDDYFIRYDTRTDLGNTPQVDGDGELWKGRGIFELTGHANYVLFGELLGVDLVGQPQLAASPDISVAIAAAYWDRRHMNPMADRDDLNATTRAINGGLNGLADRALRLAALKEGMKVAA